MLKGLALKSHISSDAPARVPRHSPRSRVGLVCSSMRNFLAGVIASEFRVFGIAVNPYGTSRIGMLSNYNIEN